MSTKHLWKSPGLDQWSVPQGDNLVSQAQKVQSKSWNLFCRLVRRDTLRHVESQRSARSASGRLEARGLRCDRWTRLPYCSRLLTLSKSLCSALEGGSFKKWAWAVARCPKIQKAWNSEVLLNPVGENSNLVYDLVINLTWPDPPPGHSVGSLRPFPPCLRVSWNLASFTCRDEISEKAWLIENHTFWEHETAVAQIAFGTNNYR